MSQPFAIATLLSRSCRALSLLALPCAMAACGSSNGAPLLSVTSQRVGGECTLDIDFPHGAMALYVSDLDLTLPRENSTPTDGAIYYGLEATLFPDGFVGPIRYGDEEVANAMLAQQPARWSDVVYPMPLESDDKNAPSLLTERSTCEPGKGGCFKVGLVTINGNSEIEIEDFSCDEKARTWKTSAYNPPPKQ